MSRNIRQQYSSVANEDDGGGGGEKQQNGTVDSSSSSSSGTEQPVLLHITILDFCHTRFPLEIARDASVRQLKEEGAKLHNVGVSQQRLIYQGKLLSDEDTLADSGIRDSSIVHLFPRPRVVITNSSCDNNEEEQEESAARVPTIVMDQEEAERRGQILVLGSTEYIESQNNVKLFSFMLLIISLIELLNLMAIALGQGGSQSSSSEGSQQIPTEHDDFFHDDNTNDYNHVPTTNVNSTSSNNNNSSAAYDIVQHWSALSYVDLVVSVLGVYVALLGIKATNDNSLDVARFYLYGTCVTAVGWLVYNFIMSYKVDEAIAAEKNDDIFQEDTVLDQAIQVMVLPVIVWCLCIFRAWQFQHLLAEAEREAVERLARTEDHHDDDDEEAVFQNEGEGIA